MSVSIVIPHYNRWELTHALLSDLYRHERGNIDEIVLVNNGGIDVPEIAGGEQYWIDMFAEYCPVWVIPRKTNVGFLLAANLGLQEAAGTIKVLISNDVRIKGKFVQSLQGVLGPRTLVGQKLYLTSTGWNNFEGRIFPYLEGFFLAAHSGSWEELGYFDTVFVPSDFEDVSLSTMALSLGYQLIPLNLPHIEHSGAGTLGYNPEREKITQANKEKFRIKWVDNG